jgi:phage-related minor tail protein
MAGGKTGLMGEAGPEAIMPLKRGANGKLGVQMEGGAGGDTVVNNYFNVSANGDDSVKRIIRGEIPRITEATKAAVVDAKRRGGSYGRSF